MDEQIWSYPLYLLPKKIQVAYQTVFFISLFNILAIALIYMTNFIFDQMNIHGQYSFGGKKPGQTVNQGEVFSEVI